MNEIKGIRRAEMSGLEKIRLAREDGREERELAGYIGVAIANSITLAPLDKYTTEEREDADRPASLLLPRMAPKEQVVEDLVSSSHTHITATRCSTTCKIDGEKDDRSGKNYSSPR